MSSQVIFELPKPVEDFSLYTLPMHCDALERRLSREMVIRKDSLFLDEKLQIQLRGLRVIDSTPFEIRIHTQNCLKKVEHSSFSIGKDKYGVDHYDVLARLYWRAGDIKSFFSLVDRKDRSIPSDSLKAKAKFRNSVLGIIESNIPVNLAIYDSLIYSYFLNNALSHGEDLRKFQDRIYQMERMAMLRRGINPVDRLNRLANISQIIDSMDLERFRNDEISDSISRILNGIKYRHRSILSEIRKSENLDSLERFGPESYFRGLIKNSHLAGLDTVSAPFIPLGRKVASLNPMYIFSSESNNNNLVSYNTGNNHNAHSGMPDMAGPAIMIFVDRPIPKQSKDFNNMVACGFAGKGRYLRAESCHAMIKYLKFVNKTFPDVQLIMVIPTRGHLGGRLTSDPKVEAHLIRKVFHDFHGIRADVVVHNTDFYNMPTPDGRRVSLPPEYVKNYIGNSKGDLYHGHLSPPDDIPGFLVAPGRIVVADNVGPASHEVLERLMRWYRNSGRNASLQVNH